MSLLEVRKQFIKISGRFDLVVDAVDYADDGANFYISAGQLWLDRLETFHKSYSRVFETLTAGDWYKLITPCRAITEVWCSPDDNDEKWKLDKADFNVIRAAYAEIPTSLDQGDPLYYTPIFVRTSPEVSSTVTIDYFGTTEFKDETKDHFEYNGLIFMPPAESAATLEVHGMFYQPKLTADADENYWTEVNPLILVMAACRALDMTYRNTAGVKDWTNNIRSEMLGLGMDLVEEQAAETDEMEG